MAWEVLKCIIKVYICTNKVNVGQNLVMHIS
jgi:hypothetical protein